MIDRLSHGDRKRRRGRMARAVASGEVPADVAERFRVTPGLVYRACIEFGVPVPRRRSRRPTTRYRCFDVLAAIRRGGTNASIARAAGVSRQYVHEIRSAAGLAGLLDRGPDYAQWKFIRQEK